MVATLRIWGEAASPQAWARARWVDRTPAWAATSARVARGPMRSEPSGCGAMSRIPATDFRSTTRGVSTRCSLR